VKHTDIQFSPEELRLLNKGLKYNLHHKKEIWIKELALEAETAVSYLLANEQVYIRGLISHNIEQLYKQRTTRISTITELKWQCIQSTVSKANYDRTNPPYSKLIKATSY